MENENLKDQASINTTEGVAKKIYEPEEIHALIAEKKIDSKIFPKNIQDGISLFSLTLGRYNKNKSQKDADTLRKQSIVLAHDIQDWSEKDLPEEIVAPIVVVAEEPEPVKPVEEPEPVEEINYIPRRVLRRPHIRQKQEQKQQPIPLTPEQKILEALDGDGCIGLESLREIIGKNPGFSVSLGNITLHNKPFTEVYELVK